MSILDVKDRIPTEILPNGAVRYGVYDENNNLIRYEYMKREDEPIEEGTPINKILFDNFQGDLYTQDRYNVPTGSYVALTGHFFDMNLPLTSYETGKKVSLKPPTYKAVVGANESIYDSIGLRVEETIYVNGKYVAVGQSGVILTSEDGIDWTVQTSGTINGLTSVTYGNGKYVTVGVLGIILTSEDAITWTSQTSGTTKDLMGVTYGEGKYVAVGNTGTLLTSEDAVTWTPQTSGVSYNLNGVTYSEGKYVAVGAGGTILTSEDAVTWTPQTSGVTGVLYKITYGNGKYVAVGQSSVILTSEDAVTWTSQNAGITGYFNDVIYGNGKYVIVGGTGAILTSENAITWTSRTSGTTNALTGVTYGEGKYVAVANGGLILTSENAVTWEINKSIRTFDSFVNPYLNINNLGAKQINGTLKPNEKYDLVYNGESWDVVGKNFISGTYTGNSTTAKGSQEISLPFTPDLVIVGENGYSATYFRTEKIKMGTNYNYTETKYDTSYGYVQITNDGFTAYNGSSNTVNHISGMNYTGSIYNYIAMKF